MLRKKLFYPLFFISILLSSCEFKCSVGDSTAKKEKEGKYKPVEKDGTLLYNGISLTANKVKVKKAYLVVNDSTGKAIDEGNFVDIRTGVKLILLVDSGWTEINNKVWLGASMNVVTEAGETILEKPDMLKEYDETGITPEDSKILGFSVFFSSWQAEGQVTVEVSFKVWDKKSDAFIEGSYTLHSK